jgi:hypothetical protein
LSQRGGHNRGHAVFLFLLYFQQVMNLPSINSMIVFWRVCLRRNSILSGTAYIAVNGFTESVAWGL